MDTFVTGRNRQKLKLYAPVRTVFDASQATSKAMGPGVAIWMNERNSVPVVFFMAINIFRFMEHAFIQNVADPFKHIGLVIGHQHAHGLLIRSS
jgi:fructose 1,6-bisphosphatase